MSGRPRIQRVGQPVPLSSGKRKGASSAPGSQQAPQQQRPRLLDLGADKELSRAERERRSDCLTLQKFFAEEVMKLGEDQWAVQHAEGKGFCWGSAVLLAYGGGLLDEFVSIPKGVVRDWPSPPATGTVGRVIEALTRESIASLVANGDGTSQAALQFVRDRVQISLCAWKHTAPRDSTALHTRAMRSHTRAT